ncbi:MAG: alanine--tRNA ligase [Planctomycetes bacterium]|nr:alanine--tRNA ligase [Planctomycetota bacterium]
MRTDEIRSTYLEFFAERGHQLRPSDSLVPGNDPTLLFTGAGMNQFKDQFLGIGTENFKRATTAQKCIRTGDIMNVGVTPSHHTFFEMMGNFSFGDYFKREAIEWAWEFMTGVLKVPEKLLQVSVYHEDEEAFGIWKTVIGLPESRIIRLGEHDNFWPADAPTLGPNGPCGPCSEIFYDRGEKYGCDSPECGIECGCRRHVEVWNLVFTQFDRQPDGSLPMLPQNNIDTGMGLERMAAVMQDVPTNMDIDIFQPLVQKVAELSGKSYGSKPESDMLLRRIADHARAVTFCISDGVLPANTHRGYVLKRLLRRAVLDGRTLGIGEAFLHTLVPMVGTVMAAQYPEVKARAENIADTVRNEEDKFLSTLARGLTIIDTAIARAKETGHTAIDGETAFELHDTYGFPFELAEEVVAREGLGLDREGFDEAMEAARQKAREGAKMTGDIFAKGPLGEVKKLTGPTSFTGYEELAGGAKVIAIVRDTELVEDTNAGEEVEIILDQSPFYAESGGQIGDIGSLAGADNLVVEIVDTQKADGIFIHIGRILSGALRRGAEVACEVDAARRRQITRNHTSAHLLHWALRKVLGEKAEQKGSWVGPDRMRFDFQHNSAMTATELRRVEELVNEQVLENTTVTKEVLSIKEAQKRGAIALFGEKYGETVRMVSCGSFSKELCGGCHVDRTGDIGYFRILAEEAVAAGIRRIESCTGLAALHVAHNESEILQESARILKLPAPEMPKRLHGLLEENRELRKKLTEYRQQNLADRIREMAARPQEIDDVPYLAIDLGQASGKDLRNASDTLKAILKSGVGLLGCTDEGKVSLVCVVSKDLQQAGIKAGEVVGEAAAIVGGKGGGRPDMAQAGGREPEKLPEALQALPGIIQKLKKN